MHSTIVEATMGDYQSNHNASQNVTTTRAALPFDSAASNRFHLPKRRRYAPQYAHIYFCRLTHLREHLAKSAQYTLGPPSESLRYANRIVGASISDDSTMKSQETVIFGVVFRQMSSKPSILGLYDQASHDLIPAPPVRSKTPYPGEGDKVFLEDENGRCKLDVSSLCPLPNCFVTGFVIAVRGVEDRSTGAFRVFGYASVLPAPQPSLPVLSADRYVCIVSSLRLSNACLSAELFLEFLKGNTGDQEEEEYSAKIGHLIIAGNMVSRASVSPSHKPLAVGEKERIADPIVEADRFVSALVSSLPVSIMPGEDDPANCLLPQQPFHRCLLPSSSRNSNLSLASNPYVCQLEGRVLLATSGQNVTDFSLYRREETNAEFNDDKKTLQNGNGTINGEGYISTSPRGDRVLDILDSMLTNRHIAPSCPDTLGAYPFYDQDPFVVESTPHVFVAGNQQEFATRTMSAPVLASHGTERSMQVDAVERSGIVRLISVPRFDSTGQAVFVNLRTLDCTVREFAMCL